MQQKISCYVFIVTETLLNAVQDIYKKLVRSSDGEKFYSTFYSQIVLTASTNFPNLEEPLCTLLATKLADKLFYYKKPQQLPSNKPSPVTEKEMGGLQYLSGYVVRKFLKKAKNKSQVSV